MAQSLPSTNIEAQVGNVGGGSQVAVGTHILQIGSVEGGVVYFSQGEPTAPRPIAPPVRLRPRAFPGLLDRVSETESVVQALESKECVECSGEPGSGKTSLLRHLSYHPRTDGFPSGVIYFQVNRQTSADLLKSLFDAFYEYDSPLKPTETQIRHYLQNVSALILLDDVEITREQAEYLMNVAPNCTFITASTERSLFGEAREVILKGLPADEALALFEREFGRALSEEERSYAQALCESLGYNPRRILRAASQAREEGRLLPELAVLPHPGPVLPATQAPAAAVVKPRSEDEDKVLSALAVFYGAPVHAEHLAAVADVQNAAQVLDDLEGRALVQSHEGRYSLTGDVSGTLRRERVLVPWLARALAHFADWAEQNRREPKLIAAEAQPILLMLEWGVAAERWSEVQRLGHAAEEALALSGKWDMWAVALQCVLKAARAQGDKADEAWALHQLGTRALCLGERSAAAVSLNEALSMRETLNDKSGAAVTRHNLQILLGPPTPNGQNPKPAPPPPLLLLYKLIVTALLLMAGGAVALRYWPSKPIANPARIVEFSVSPTTVAANAQAQLCYEILGASSVRIEPDIGEKKPATKECLTVTPQQTTVYTLTAIGLDGSTISRQVTVNVEAPPAAPSAQILRFAVERRNGPGGPSDVRFQLCYGVRDADRVEIDNGVGEVAAVERQCVPVKPDQTTVYTLTATGSDGQTVRQQVTVDATKPPPPPAQILSFDPSPASIVAGETTQLCYRLSDASSAHIDPGVGDVSAGSDRLCVNVAPRETATYTLTALNPEGKSVSKRATVAVTPPAPKINIFAAETNPVVAGSRVRLCYEVLNAIRVEINNGVGPVRDARTGCAETVVQFASKTFTLTATGRDGRTTTATQTVTVTIPSPEISLSVSPETIQSGETAQLCYRVANVRSFGVEPGVGRRRISSNPAGEECVPVQPRSTTTYTLTTTDLNGQTVSRQVNVNVTAPTRKHAGIIFFNADKERIKAGESVRLCYGVSDAVRVSISPLRSRQGLPPSEKNCVDDFPKQSQTYTLIAVGEDKQPESRNVNVEVFSEPRGGGEQPGSGQGQQPSVRITRLEIKRSRLHGMQLCYAMENANSARVEPDFGGVKLPGDCLNIQASEPRTYTLTATGPDGQTDSRSVEYTPPPPPKPTPIRITGFSPAAQTIDLGAQAKICYSTFGEGTALISPQVGEVPPSLFKHCVSVAPRETRVYTLTVTGPEGQKDSRQVTVNVRQPVIQ